MAYSQHTLRLNPLPPSSFISWLGHQSLLKSLFLFSSRKRHPVVHLQHHPVAGPVLPIHQCCHKPRMATLASPWKPGAELRQLDPSWCPLVHSFHAWQACWRKQPARRKRVPTGLGFEPSELCVASWHRRWYLQVCLLEQKVGGFFIDMVERKWIKSTNEINWKKNQNSNKQTNMARKLKGNERKSWCMSWHNAKISERTEKWFFRYGNLCLYRHLSGGLLGWASVPRGDRANTRLKAELTKDSRKTRGPPSGALDVATTLWPHTGTELPKPRPVSRVLKAGGWGTARERMPAQELAAQRSPWRLHSEEGILLPHSSFLQDR